MARGLGNFCLCIFLIATGVMLLRDMDYYWQRIILGILAILAGVALLVGE